ncbi:hypothetical protein COS66_01050 [Candidatus Berkelbacteria bacterium CG06_land_8_20_14_3_00_43_10]|uniref:Adenylate kinase n=1 Tax=Candidatus Berkelbacteria bacterium CG10_big_fil_rev_8_21_14_0_10_43_14 TaxID=1974515 RepID=A0A2M6R8U1_9BACT|nr:MAG: hypothetical protein AUK41_01100 [Candidatus Berkelbacteria bacterium CG2_30_43_20]PIS06926.1 MAG: hypothetical protein COT79_02075 [Candidatus Berkelbacteria bacterium CG10_big_fil_rev_8_21_14_0_10_43_14]PIU87393.1 MAG: hypothetical protein COS66_01050 [Candidatus Berkelbacteria bacterium CG06_land_8_20_14_3_00_43_10]
MDRYALIFVGPQGSGKGTQAKYFSEYLHAPLIGTGEIFRRHAKRSSLISLTISRYIRKGKLVPNTVIRLILTKKMRLHTHDPVLLFDGVPRTLSQKIILDALLKRNNIVHVRMILVNIPKNISLQRLRNRKREDDTQATIESRLSDYYSKTVPMIHAYKDDNRVIVIDGTPSIAHVTYSIKEQLKIDKEFGLLIK